MRYAIALSLVAACGSDAAGAAEDTTLPDESTLCKLVVGYDPDSKGPVSVEVLGTNSDDVRAVLGEPEARSDTSMSYEWCLGADCVKRAKATLAFAEADRCYYETGKPITPPYWLSSIQVDGFTRPHCWVVGSETPKLCTECIDPGKITACK